MGLYDRDYMRDNRAPEDADEAVLGRLPARRRRLLWGGVIILLAAIVAWFAT